MNNSSPEPNHRGSVPPVDNRPHEELNRWWMQEQAKRPETRYPIRTPVRILLAIGSLLLVAAACWSVYLLTEM
jgi:hypothetical protein